MTLAEIWLFTQTYYWVPIVLFVTLGALAWAEHVRKCSDE